MSGIFVVQEEGDNAMTKLREPIPTVAFVDDYWAYSSWPVHVLFSVVHLDPHWEIFVGDGLNDSINDRSDRCWRLFSRGFSAIPDDTMHFFQSGKLLLQLFHRYLAAIQVNGPRPGDHDLRRLL
jgi:hypothetical protein